MNIRSNFRACEYCESGFFVFDFMAQYRDIGDQMASLDIEEEKNESLVFDGHVDEEVNRYELCLVGRLLTEKNINF